MFTARRIVLLRVGTGLRAITSLASFLVLGVLVLAGFLGSRDPLSNPLPLTVWTLLWVGLTLVQGLAGNVWAWINPWYGPVRVVCRLMGFKEAPHPYPLPVKDRERGASTSRPASFSPSSRGEGPAGDEGRLGRVGLRGPLPAAVGCWPAVFLFFAFAWFELIYPAPDDPARLAWAVAFYWVFNFFCMLVFGYETWSRRGECLSVFFGMIAQLGTVELATSTGGRRPQLSLCWPGAKLREAAPLPLSGMLFLLLALASVSFDGLSRTFFWLGMNGINPLEFPGRSALIGVNSAGLLLTFATLSASVPARRLYRRTACRRRTPVSSSRPDCWSGRSCRSRSPTIFPTIWRRWSSTGNMHWSLSRTRSRSAGTCSAPPICRSRRALSLAPVRRGCCGTCKPAAIIAGHMLAVLIAHLLAARLHPSPQAAALSQAPLAVLMVAYTVFGLWLLSTPTVG